MNDLGFVFKQAGVVRRAFERGEITAEEHSRWLDELKRPRDFWEWLLS